MLHQLGNKNKYSRIQQLVPLGIDMSVFTFLFHMLTAHMFPDRTTPIFIAPMAFMALLAWLLVSWLYQLHSHLHLRTCRIILLKHLQGMMCALLLQLLANRLFSLQVQGSLRWLLLLNAGALLGTVTTKVLLLKLYQQVYCRHKEKYIIVGCNATGQQLYQYMQQHQPCGYAFMGFYDDAPACATSVLRGRVADVYDLCKRHAIDAIYFTLPNQPALLQQLSLWADDHYVYFGFLSACEANGEPASTPYEFLLPSIPSVQLETNCL